MEILSDIFTARLDIVFAVYGLAFVAMGIAIFVQPRRDSTFELAGLLKLLAYFAVIHGWNEWLDMYAIIRGRTVLLNTAGLISLIISFIFLFEFGRRLTYLVTKKMGVWVSAVAGSLLFGFLLGSREGLSIWPRYFLGFPGSMLTALGFMLYYRLEEKAIGSLGVRKYFISGGIAFGIYGILGGLVVPKASFFPASFLNDETFYSLTGIPVQVFRAVCAIIAAWAVSHILTIFNWEIKGKIQNALNESESARKFINNVIANMSDCLVVTSPDGRINTVNQAALDLLGYKERELVGKDIGILFPEKKKRALKRAGLLGEFAKKEKKSLRNYETVYRDKRGAEIPVLLSCTILRETDCPRRKDTDDCPEFSSWSRHCEKSLGRVYVAKDITERKKVEEVEILRRSKVFLEKVLNSITESVSIIDVHSFKILSVNKAFLDKEGLKEEEAIGRTCYEITHHLSAPCDSEEHPCPLTEALLTSRHSVYEHVHYDRDGREVYIEVSASPIRNEKGEVIQVVHIARDITDRKKAERSLRLVQLGELVSDIAHEVNNPLMVISGRAQLSLMEDLKNKEVNENLKIIMDQCQRAKGIVERVLRFSKPGKGERKEVNINESMDYVIRLIEHQYSLKNIVIVKKYASSLSVVKVDEKQIQEVFMNLLGNAADAMQDGGTITIVTAEEDNYVRVDVSDTGVGMSKGDMRKIFTPFFTTKEKGTGLGLSVCYSIIEAHGGELKYRSKWGAGTTATVLLPAVSAGRREGK